MKNLRADLFGDLFSKVAAENSINEAQEKWRVTVSSSIEASQHVLRICAPQRVYELLQGSRMELDAEQVVARLNRLRSDMDFGSSVHEEYGSLAQLHEIQELIVRRDRAKLKAFLNFEYDRFHPGRSSRRIDFSTKASSPEAILAIRRALDNFALAMLIYFGVSCGSALRDTRGTL